MFKQILQCFSQPLFCREFIICSLIIKAYNIPILEVAGFEADDVIGTIATKAKEKGKLIGVDIDQSKTVS